MRKVVLVTAGEERLPDGTAEAIRAFADFRAKRCETPEELLATFPDAEVCWMFGPTKNCVRYVAALTDRLRRASVENWGANKFC